MSKWTIDADHSSANFKIQHRGIAFVTGQMTGVKGEIVFEKDNVESASFNGSISAATINTGHAYRDGHLKGDDFFDAEKYPEIFFETKSVKKVSEDKFSMLGTLKVKEISKEVTLDVTYLGETEKQNEDGTIELVSAFTATTKMDRRDFGLNWNMELPGGNWLVGHEVQIEVNIEATTAK